MCPSCNNQGENNYQKRQPYQNRNQNNNQRTLRNDQRPPGNQYIRSQNDQPNTSGNHYRSFNNQSERQQNNQAATQNQSNRKTVNIKTVTLTCKRCDIKRIKPQDQIAFDGNGKVICHYCSQQNMVKNRNDNQKCQECKQFCIKKGEECVKLNDRFFKCICLKCYIKKTKNDFFKQKNLSLVEPLANKRLIMNKKQKTLKCRVCKLNRIEPRWYFTVNQNRQICCLYCSNQNVIKMKKHQEKCVVCHKEILKGNRCIRRKITDKFSCICINCHKKYSKNNYTQKKKSLGEELKEGSISLQSEQQGDTQSEIQEDIEACEEVINAECQICYKSQNEDDQLVKLECDDWMCVGCLDDYFDKTDADRLFDKEQLQPFCSKCKAEGNKSLIQTRYIDDFHESGFISNARYNQLNAKRLHILSGVYNCTVYDCVNPRCSQKLTLWPDQIQANEYVVQCVYCSMEQCCKCRVEAQQGHIHREEQERETQNYLNRETLICPNVMCRRNVVKLSGCNHLTCLCGTQICDLCGIQIHGYDHFNQPGDCYNATHMSKEEWLRRRRRQ